MSKKPFFYPRIFSLLLTLSLSLPNPALALRGMSADSQSVQSGLEAALANGRPTPAAGLEEPVNVRDLNLKDRSTQKNIPSGETIQLIPRGGIFIPNEALPKSGQLTVYLYGLQWKENDSSYVSICAILRTVNWEENGFPVIDEKGKPGFARSEKVGRDGSDNDRYMMVSEISRKQVELSMGSKGLTITEMEKANFKERAYLPVSFLTEIQSRLGVIGLPQEAGQVKPLAPVVALEVPELRENPQKLEDLRSLQLSDLVNLSGIGRVWPLFAEGKRNGLALPKEVVTQYAELGLIAYVPPIQLKSGESVNAIQATLFWDGQGSCWLRYDKDGDGVEVVEKIEPGTDFEWGKSSFGIVTQEKTSKLISKKVFRIRLDSEGRPSVKDMSKNEIGFVDDRLLSLQRILNFRLPRTGFVPDPRVFGPIRKKIKNVAGLMRSQAPEGNGAPSAQSRRKVYAVVSKKTGDLIDLLLPGPDPVNPAVPAAAEGTEVLELQMQNLDGVGVFDLGVLGKEDPSRSGTPLISDEFAWALLYWNSLTPEYRRAALPAPAQVKQRFEPATQDGKEIDRVLSMVERAHQLKNYETANKTKGQARLALRRCLVGLISPQKAVNDLAAIIQDGTPEKTSAVAIVIGAFVEAVHHLGPGGYSEVDLYLRLTKDQRGEQLESFAQAISRAAEGSPVSLSVEQARAALVDANTRANALAGLEENQAANDYLRAFEYRPIVPSGYGEPVTYQPSPETWLVLPGLIGEVLDEAEAKPRMQERIRGRVESNPAVLARLAAMYEHAPFMLEKMKPGPDGKKVPDPEGQAAVVKQLILQIATDDAVMQFIERELPPASYDFFLENPAPFAQAVLLYEDFKGKESDPTAETDLKKKLTDLAGGQSLEAKEISALLNSLRRRPPLQRGRIGQSSFFQSLLDNETLSVIPYLVEAYRNGLNHLEIPADLLPFDPSKRLPAEFPAQELARIREVAKILGLTLTLHSGIVGPQHPKTKFIAVLEDPADNVKLMQQTLDLAEGIGATGVVFHGADRQGEDALDRYVEICRHAVGKRASDRSWLRVQWENYMSKKLLDGKRPYSTLEEHFQLFSRIVKKAAEKDPRVLRHVGLILDSAHFNLVENLEDPIVGIAKLRGLAKELAGKLDGSLKRIGLSREDFISSLVSETHNNQNVGPGIEPLLGLGDYGTDVHGRVSAKGMVPIRLFLTMLDDLGFRYRTAPAEDGSSLPEQARRRIDLAEQKDAMDGKDISFMEEATPQGPDLKAQDDPFDFFVEKGTRILTEALLAEEDPEGELHKAVQKHFIGSSEEEAYYWVAGRFGIPDLLEHLRSREEHKGLDLIRRERKAAAAATVLPAERPSLKEELGDLPLVPFGVEEIITLKEGDVIIKQGVPLEQLRQEGKNKFYFVSSGSLEVTQKRNLADSRTIPLAVLGPGAPFGVGVFLSAIEGNPNPQRNATITATRETVLCVFPEEQLNRWLNYDPLRERILRIYHERLRQNASKWETETSEPSARAAGLEEVVNGNVAEIKSVVDPILQAVREIRRASPLNAVVGRKIFLFGVLNNEGGLSDLVKEEPDPMAAVRGIRVTLEVNDLTGRLNWSRPQWLSDQLPAVLALEAAIARYNQGVAPNAAGLEEKAVDWLQRLLKNFLPPDKDLQTSADQLLRGKAVIGEVEKVDQVLQLTIAGDTAPIPAPELQGQVFTVYYQEGVVSPEVLNSLAAQLKPKVGQMKLEKLGSTLTKDNRETVVNSVKEEPKEGPVRPKALLLLNPETIEQFDEDLTSVNPRTIPAVMVGIKLGMLDDTKINSVLFYLLDLLSNASHLVIERLADVFTSQQEKATFFLRTSV